MCTVYAQAHKVLRQKKSDLEKELASLSFFDFKKRRMLKVRLLCNSKRFDELRSEFYSIYPLPDREYLQLQEKYHERKHAHIIHELTKDKGE